MGVGSWHDCCLSKGEKEMRNETMGPSFGSQSYQHVRNIFQVKLQRALVLEAVVAEGPNPGPAVLEGVF